MLHPVRRVQVLKARVGTPVRIRIGLNYRNVTALHHGRSNAINSLQAMGKHNILRRFRFLSIIRVSANRYVSVRASRCKFRALNVLGRSVGSGRQLNVRIRKIMSASRRVNSRAQRATS